MPGWEVLAPVAASVLGGLFNRKSSGSETTTQAPEPYEPWMTGLVDDFVNEYYGTPKTDSSQSSGISGGYAPVSGPGTPGAMVGWARGVLPGGERGSSSGWGTNEWKQLIESNPVRAKQLAESDPIFRDMYNKALMSIQQGSGRLMDASYVPGGNISTPASSGSLANDMVSRELSNSTDANLSMKDKFFSDFAERSGATDDYINNIASLMTQHPAMNIKIGGQNISSFTPGQKRSYDQAAQIYDKGLARDLKFTQYAPDLAWFTEQTQPMFKWMQEIRRKLPQQTTSAEYKEPFDFVGTIKALTPLLLSNSGGSTYQSTEPYWK